MFALIIILLCFIPAIFSHSKLEISHPIQTQKAIFWLPIIAIVMTIASAAYSYAQMRKMQKRNRLQASQLDGSLADEGVSFSDIAGSPHLYGNIVWKGNESTTPIKK